MISHPLFLITAKGVQEPLFNSIVCSRWSIVNKYVTLTHLDSVLTCVGSETKVTPPVTRVNKRGKWIQVCSTHPTTNNDTGMYHRTLLANKNKQHYLRLRCSVCHELFITILKQAVIMNLSWL